MARGTHGVTVAQFALVTIIDCALIAGRSSEKMSRRALQTRAICFAKAAIWIGTFVFGALIAAERVTNGASFTYVRIEIARCISDARLAMLNVATLEVSAGIERILLSL